VKVPAISESAQAKGPEMKDYAVVAEQNLFHPERRIPADSKDEALQKPDVILYGTLDHRQRQGRLPGGQEVPLLDAGRGPRQMMLRKGDKLSGYTLQEVEETQLPS